MFTSLCKHGVARRTFIIETERRKIDIPSIRENRDDEIFLLLRKKRIFSNKKISNIENRKKKKYPYYPVRESLRSHRNSKINKQKKKTDLTYRTNLNIEYQIFGNFSLIHVFNIYLLPSCSQGYR